MQFKFETSYDTKGLAVMAKGLRKTVRKKRNRRTRILGYIAILLGLAFLRLSGESQSGFSKGATIAAIAVMVITLIYEDKMNGWLASKRMLKGTEKAVAVFDTDSPESYFSQTDIGSTQFLYSTIAAIAETDSHFVFALNANYAQLYDKESLTGGTVDEFRAFISKTTGKEVTSVK